MNHEPIRLLVRDAGFDSERKRNDGVLCSTGRARSIGSIGRVRRLEAALLGVERVTPIESQGLRERNAPVLRVRSIVARSR